MTPANRGFVAATALILSLGSVNGTRLVDRARISPFTAASPSLNLVARSQSISADFDRDGSVAHFVGSGTISAVVAWDVDRDGDLDAVAATSSGQVIVFANDGHGRFTPMRAPPKHGPAVYSRHGVDAPPNSSNDLEGSADAGSAEKIQTSSIVSRSPSTHVLTADSARCSTSAGSPRDPRGPPLSA